MKINKLLQEKQTLSFEVFPPKQEQDEDLSGISQTLEALTVAEPDFVSVTYGAAGKNRPRALDIAELILARKMLPLSHLTAVGYTKENTQDVLASLSRRGVSNILGLRGDIPENIDFPHGPWHDFRYATDLIQFIKTRNDFCIGAAAYPEGHTESPAIHEDIAHMLLKIRMGASFFITQLFFDNEKFLNFIEQARNAGVQMPILAGIMPIFNAAQIRRLVEISGCSVPRKLEKLLDRYAEKPSSMADAGTDYAAEQIQELWDAKVDGIHIYTMNKSQQILEILKRTSIDRVGCPNRIDTIGEIREGSF